MGHLRRDTPLWGSGPSDVLVSTCPVARWLGLDGELDISLSFSATYVITLYYPNPRLSYHFFILFWLLCAFYYCKSLLPTIGRLDPRVPPDSVLLHSTVKLAPINHFSSAYVVSLIAYEILLLFDEGLPRKRRKVRMKEKLFPISCFIFHS